MNIVIADSRGWYKEMAADLRAALDCEVIKLTQPEELTPIRLASYQPAGVFFTHWSHFIPENIYQQFPCVIFHMTDLPFGRGGSPLQNLIARGIYTTKLTALACDKEIDAGPIYLKKELSLEGNAQEIYYRANQMMVDMIVDIIKLKPVPQPQIGIPVNFKRRTPAESNMQHLTNSQEMFDYIRMLDADGYPRAYLECGNFKLIFSGANLIDNKLIASVEIKEKPKC